VFGNENERGADEVKVNGNNPVPGREIRHGGSINVHHYPGKISDESVVDVPGFGAGCLFWPR